MGELKADAQSFLRQFFEQHDEEEGFITLWQPKSESKKSQTLWGRSVEEIGQQVDKIDATRCAFFNVGISKEQKGPGQRAKLADIKGIMGFWIDVDYAHDVHSKKHLFRTRPDALSFLRSVFPPELAPSIIVDSGHGVHGYWLLKEAWYAEDDEEYGKMGQAVRDFVYTLQRRAAERGVVLDAVHDLTRLMRLPGTYNCKEPGDQPQSKVVESNNKRFIPEDFEPYLEKSPQKMAQGDGQSAGSGDEPWQLVDVATPVLSEHVEIPQYIFDNLAMDDHFLPTWNKQRQDLEGRARNTESAPGDNSLSAYDMSLANIGASFGLSDQQLCDLLVAFRRKHASSEREFRKSLRVDYYQRTIYRARQRMGIQEADNNLQTMAMQLEQAQVGSRNAERGDQDEEAPPPPPPPEPSSIIKELRRVLRVPLTKILKYMGDEPQYEMHFQDGSKTMLGDVTFLIDQAKLRKRLAAHCSTYLQRFRNDLWTQYAPLLLAACEEVHTGSDTTEEGNIRSALHDYLDSQIFAQDWRNATKNKMPFRKDDKIFVFGKSFRDYMRMNGEPRSAKEVGIAFAAAGGANVKVRFPAQDEGQKSKTENVYDVTDMLDHIPTGALRKE